MFGIPQRHEVLGFLHNTAKPGVYMPLIPSSQETGAEGSSQVQDQPGLHVHGEF